MLWAGAPFFVRGAQSIANRSPNMWTLIGLGTGAAFVYRRGGHRRAAGVSGRSSRWGGGGLLRGGAAVIISLTLPGRFELRARSQTSAAIKSLLGLAPRPRAVSPPTAAANPTYRCRTCVGDLLRVRPGEKGAGWTAVVVEGSSSLDEVHADRRAAAGHQARGDKSSAPR